MLIYVIYVYKYKNQTNPNISFFLLFFSSALFVCVCIFITLFQILNFQGRRRKMSTSFIYPRITQLKNTFLYRLKIHCL